jgi:glycosyltransferase involved in cell wall biosynthesis
MRRIRLLFLSSVDAQSTNAQSLNTRELVLRLDASRFEITLLYRYEPDPRLLNREHIRLLPLPSRLKTLYLLREMLSGYDIIAYMDYSPASYLFLHLPAVARRHAKTVLHAEGPVRLDDAPRLLQFLYGGVVTRCDVYTAITDRVARDYASILHRKARYILPVGVDVGLFAPSDGSHGAPTVLFVGTLMKSKAPLDVLEAAAHFLNVRFRLIGPGRDGYEKVVRKRIAELRLGNVLLEGAKPQAEIAAAMRESDIFLLPSRGEGLPKVTLEAAASGLPCVVFRDYDTPSVVDGITGFQVSTFEEMLNKIRLLIADPHLRRKMGAAGRKHAEQFDWNLIGKRWQDAYLNIAAGS